MYKKINFYVNGEYICSSNRYRTCKEAYKAIWDSGILKWQSVDGEHCLMLKTNGCHVLKTSYM